MIAKIHSVALLAIVAAAALPASGATYYVAPSGNDSFPGTSSASPWRTIGKAASAVPPGSTVNIAAGTYNESITIGVRGSVGAQVTFKGLNRPVLAGNLLINGSYVTVDGMTVSPPTASSPKAGYFYSAVTLDGDHNTFSNGVVTRYGAVATNHATAISTGGSYNTVTRSTINDLNDIDGFHLWGHDITISNNTVVHLNQTNYAANHTDFVQTWSSSSSSFSYNVTIIANLVHDCSGQLGNTETDGNGNLHNWTFANNCFVNIGNALCSGLPNTAFYNNVFDHCGGTNGTAVALYGVSGRSSSVGDRFANNVFVDNHLDVEFPSASPSQLSLFSNNYFGTGTFGPEPGFAYHYRGNNAVNGGNPRFRNVAAFDYHLLSGSVLIGRGMWISTLTVDADNRSRSSTVPCIGPYQY